MRGGRDELVGEGLFSFAREVGLEIVGMRLSQRDVDRTSTRYLQLSPCINPRDRHPSHPNTRPGGYQTHSVTTLNGGTIKRTNLESEWGIPADWDRHDGASFVVALCL